MRSSRAADRGLAAAALAVLGVIGIAGVVVSAHRLDEFLQAARIAVAPGRAEIELVMTPGAAVADATVVEIDADNNGTLSADEQGAYAARVVALLALDLDGRPVPMRLVGARFPDLGAMRGGDGAIRLQLDASLPAQTAGAHHLLFKNNNRRDESVYLANATVPLSDRVSIAGQRRTADQHELTIDYALKGESRGRFRPGCWLVLPQRRSRRCGSRADASRLQESYITHNLLQI